MPTYDIGGTFAPERDITVLPDNQIVEVIVKWFNANFEDPAENTPYESAEGGYQFIWGGPCNARGEIEDQFGELPERILELVFKEIDECNDWVPNQNRMVEEGEDEES